MILNLLSTNKNINKIFKQAKEFKVKNIIISDYKKVIKKQKKFKKKKNKIFIIILINLIKFLKKKIFYSMSSITGLNGLKTNIKIN